MAGPNHRATIAVVATSRLEGQCSLLGNMTDGFPPLALHVWNPLGIFPEGIEMEYVAVLFFVL